MNIYVLFCFLCCRRFIDVWFVDGLCYNVVLFIVLLQCFICARVIQKDKLDLISRIYQIMVDSMLKKLSCRYSSYNFIKFVSFMLIYYTINLDIISSYMVFTYLYLGSIDLLQV